ncbi:MAG: hypothetical protein GY807_21010 [Gammaproteobacteria bacterium]|nr:hypothetical protein [Gammaproteobacteria bacterium]
MIYKTTAETMTKAGRKRKTGMRESNGRIQRAPDYANQQEADTVSVGVQARVLHLDAPDKQARDPDWGHTLGVLRLKNIIDKRQMDAGNFYMDQYFRYVWLKGFPPRNPKVAAYAELIAGMSSSHIHDDDTVKRAEARLNDAQTAVIDALGIQQSIPAFSALEKFAINQEHYGQCTPARAGPLKECLNALARHYGV